MKRGVNDLNFLGSDIGSNQRPHDAYALPHLSMVSDVHSGRLTGGPHIRDELRSPRRRPGLNRLYRMYLADLKASLAEVTQEQPQHSDPTVLKAVMVITSVRRRMH